MQRDVYVAEQEIKEKGETIWFDVKFTDQPKDYAFCIDYDSIENREYELEKYGEIESGFVILVTPLEYFKKENCIFDQGIPGPINDIIENLGFTPYCESSWECNNKQLNKEQVEQLMINEGFVKVDF